MKTLERNSRAVEMTVAFEAAGADRRRSAAGSIYRCLYNTREFCSRQSLARELNLSLPTVYQNLSKLMAAGLVQDSGEQQPTGGRKASGLSIVPDARIAVGVSITENSLRLVAADLRLGELAYQKLPITPVVCFSDLGELLAGALERFLDEFAVDRRRLLGVGITLPAVMSPDSRCITAAPTLPLEDTSLEGLTAYIPYPTYVENDATCGGYAEWFLQNSRRDMAYLSLENGVGGAILLGGSPYNGDNRRSAEFGHMCIEPGGLRCSCGRQGCLEAYCSPRRIREAVGSVEEFFERLERRDSQCELLWDNILRHIALGVYNIRMSLDCDVVLGGFLSEFLGPYLPRLKEYAADLNPFEEGAEYLHLSTLRRHAVPLGVALHFVADFLDRV